MQLANAKRDITILNNKLDVVLVFLEEIAKTFICNTIAVDFEDEDTKATLSRRSNEKYELMIKRMLNDILSGSTNIIDRLYLSKTVGN